MLDEVPAIDVDYLEAARHGARTRAAQRHRPGCWWPPGSGTARLLDNIAVEIGATAGTDGQEAAGLEFSELPWRN